MKLTTITVKYGITHNMGNYSNVRPEVELTVELEPHDNPDEARWLLMQQAREAARAEVDGALEDDDKPPKYYTGPRFSLATITSEKLVVIYPDTHPERARLPEPWDEGTSLRYHGRRLPVIRAKVVERYPDYIIIDCSDGDYSRLSVVELGRFLLFTNRERKLAVLTPSGLDRGALPGDGWSYPDHHVRRKVSLLAHLRNGDSLPNYHLIDCTDGDLSRIPTTEPVIEQAEPAKKPKRSRRKEVAVEVETVEAEAAG